MNKTILLTGVNGFVGHHLAETLHEAGENVIGVARNDEPSEENTQHLSDYISCDLNKVDEIRKINLSTVDAVIHLAGLANVGQSFAEPARFLTENVGMTTNLLQHGVEAKSGARFVVVSSGAVYTGKQALPISENGIVSHSSPYAVSKLAVEMVCDYYHGRGQDVVSMRPFNHFGPGQGKGFIVPDLLQKIKNYRDNGDQITAGDLTTARDYTDVRDVADAYRAVAVSDRPAKESVYNVCSGKSRTGLQIFSSLARALSISPLPELTINQDLIRPNDAREIVGSYDRIKDEYGWEPQHTFEETIEDVVREKL